MVGPPTSCKAVALCPVTSRHMMMCSRRMTWNVGRMGLLSSTVTQCIPNITTPHMTTLYLQIIKLHTNITTPPHHNTTQHIPILHTNIPTPPHHYTAASQRHTSTCHTTLLHINITTLRINITSLHTATPSLFHLGMESSCEKRTTYFSASPAASMLCLCISGPFPSNRPAWSALRWPDRKIHKDNIKTRKYL